MEDDHLPLGQRQGGQGVAQVEQLGAELGDQRRRAQAQQRLGRRRSDRSAMAARLIATRRTQASGRS
ncbi:MAG TPA: hypothetical protein VJB61_20070 [Actinomycetota bacterium]